MKSFFSILFGLILISAGCDSTSSTAAVETDKAPTTKTKSAPVVTSVKSWPTADYSEITEIGDISGPFTINGIVNKEQLNGKFYNLYRLDGKNLYILDSVKIKAGKFTFKLKDAPVGFYKVGEKKHNARAFIINPNEKELTLTVSPSNNFVTVSGSAENTAYRTYLTEKRKHDAEIKKIQKLKASHEVKLKMIQELEVTLKSKQDELADNSPNTFFSKTTRRLFSPNRYDRNKYWSDIDFSDASLVRSTVFNDRIQDYMRQHGKNGKEGMDGFLDAVDIIYAMADSGGNDDLKFSILVNMLEGFVSSKMDEPTSYIMENYIFEGDCGLDGDAKVFLENLGNKIKSLEVGGTPPDFTIADPSGKEFNLAKVASQNDFTLVLFWASWCHKCEQEMPVIKRIYDKYHAKGFEIIGVSVDMNKAAWLKGIEQKGCNWINVSQLDQWESDVAKDYRIQSTPVMYLVDSKREIILSPDELKRAHMLETWMNANYK